MEIKTNLPSATPEEMARAFPDIDPGFEPFGSRVIVQLRSPKLKSNGGLILANEVVEAEMWNTQIGKVRAIGPMAFRYRSGDKEGQLWAEKEWCKVDDFVRIPKFNQDKWFMDYPTVIKGLSGQDFPSTERVLFMLINDLDLLALKTGNPLEVKAYI